VSDLSKAARGRIDALAKGHPELAPWLLLLEEALAATKDRAWSAPLSDFKAPPQTEAPLLANSQIPVEKRAAQDLVRRLLSRGSIGGSSERDRSRAQDVDALALLEAAVNQDEGRVGAMAEGASVETSALVPVASLAAMPLLHACRERLGDLDINKSSLGYCPVCAAWPVFSELRGLERTRVLRCGRCGAGWKADPLHCVFCGERDHDKLGALVPEERAESRKVDVCNACGGYLKAVATLGALWPDAVALEDLATVDLDLAALDRGYARPDRPPVTLWARLVAAPAPELHSLV
jgi:FdhE protein